MDARDVRAVLVTAGLVLVVTLIWLGNAALNPVETSGGGTREQYCGSGASVASPGYCTAGSSS
jgi:hypothetical protein